MPDKQKVSRLEQMRVDQVEPHMPECDVAFLAGYLWEIGPTTSGGMGEAPISHMDIAAWQSNTGVDLSSWEARTLRSLSIAYLNQAHEGKSPSCPPPWAPVPRNESRKKLPTLIRDVLRS